MRRGCLRGRQHTNAGEIWPYGEGIDIGFAVGCLVAVLSISAVATWYFARRSTKVLSLARIFVTYIMIALVIVVVLQLLWLLRSH